jgi:hypothetical protein
MEKAPGQTCHMEELLDLLALQDQLALVDQLELVAKVD